MRSRSSRRMAWPKRLPPTILLALGPSLAAFGAGAEAAAPATEAAGAGAGLVGNVPLLPILLGIGALLVLQLIVVRGTDRVRRTVAWFVAGLALGVVGLAWWLAPPRYLPVGGGSRMAVAVAQGLGAALSDPARPHIVFVDGGSYSARGVDPRQMEQRLRQKTGKPHAVVALALAGANQTERRVLLDDAIALLSPAQRATLRDSSVTLLLEVHESYDRYPLAQLARNPRSDRAYGYMRPYALWRLWQVGLGELEAEDKAQMTRDAITLGVVNAMNVGLATRVSHAWEVEPAEAFAGLERADSSFRFRRLRNLVREAAAAPDAIDFPERNIADRRAHIAASLDAGQLRIIYFSPPSTTLRHLHYAKAFCRDQVPEGAACIHHGNRWLLRRLDHRRYWYDTGHLLAPGAAQYTRWLTDRMLLVMDEDAGKTGEAGR